MEASDRHRDPGIAERPRDVEGAGILIRLHAAQGNYAVTYTGTDGVPLTAGQFVETFLASDIGKRLKKPTATPPGGVTPNGAAGSGRVGLSPAELNALSPDELKSGKYFLDHSKT